MSRTLAILAVLAIVVPHAAAAGPDPRIRAIDYDPGRIVRVRGRAGTATEVVFGPDEAIQHVALGDGGTWEVAAEGAVLFLRPRGPGAPTNLIVTTNGPAGPRSYLFQLTRSVTGAPADFALRFRYPADARAKAEAAARAAAAALGRRVLDLQLAAGPFAGPRNLAWSAQGPADLQPAEVSDNGRFTVLRFAPGQPLSAVYTVDAGGAEALARLQVTGSVAVIQGAWPALRLRNGRRVLCLTNQAWRPEAAAPGLTAAPEVARLDRARTDLEPRR